MNAEEIAKRIVEIKEKILSVDGGESKEAAIIALHVFRKHLDWSQDSKLPAGELMFVLVIGLCQSIGSVTTEEYMVCLIRETCRLFRSYAPVDKLPS